MHDLLIQAACSYNLLGINTSQTEGGGAYFITFYYQRELYRSLILKASYLCSSVSRSSTYSINSVTHIVTAKQEMNTVDSL